MTWEASKEDIIKVLMEVEALKGVSSAHLILATKAVLGAAVRSGLILTADERSALGIAAMHTLESPNLPAEIRPALERAMLKCGVTAVPSPGDGS